SRIKLSCNWMAAAGHPGEDARLYAAVRAASECAVALGLAIPVGKDSMSMRTIWEAAVAVAAAAGGSAAAAPAAVAARAGAAATLSELERLGGEEPPAAAAPAATPEDAALE